MKALYQTTMTRYYSLYEQVHDQVYLSSINIVGKVKKYQGNFSHLIYCQVFEEVKKLKL